MLCAGTRRCAGKASAEGGPVPEELHFQFPHLSLDQIHSAPAYYRDHQEELDQDIARRPAAVELQQRQTSSP